MNYKLENEYVRIEFDEATGAITGLLNKKTGWQAVAQPKLSSIIKLVVPVEGHRNNRVLTETQKLSSFEKEGEYRASLGWKGIWGDKSGTMDIDVALSISLQGPDICFEMTIDNKSGQCVEEAWYPCVGGLREPKGEGEFESLTMDMCGGFHRTLMGDGFPQTCGYWGTDYPTFIKTFGSEVAQASFLLLSNDRQGLYMGMHQEEQSIVSFVHELRPGYTDSKHSRVPKTDEIGGHPAGYVVSAAQMPFVQAGEEMKLAPIVVRLFEGSWHKGLEPYLNWRKQWYGQMPQPGWLKDIDCWMTLHINSPEGCCRYRYEELPEIAREAREKGVQVLQLIGWAKDGQDGAEPYQDTDPRLGSREDLKKAVREIEALGVRVLLMCKFKWADQAIEEFREEIRPHTLKDIYGNDVQFPGYAYQTLTQQLFGGSRRCGAGLCHSSAEYRKLALREFAKIVELEPSGILYDELMNDRLLCFDPSHGHRWGESNLKGSMKLAEEFHRYARSKNPDFLFAGESPTDQLSQYYPISYVRTWDGRWEDPVHRPVLKYINPGMHIATCLTGFDDREMVNQCVTFGYVINYEPFNFKGRVTDIPDTVAYGQKAQQLRRRLWDYLWLGRFTHTVGASLTTSGPQVEYIYSVFENLRNGKKAVVIANQGQTHALNASVCLDSGNHSFELYRVEGEERESCDGDVTVEPRCLVVLVEK